MIRNIVLITIDSLRADHCGFMGYDRETTPNIDKMARKGLYFENAYAPSPRTLSSMASLFTGELIIKYVECRSAEEFGRNAKLNLGRRETLAEALSDRGYSTGAFNPNAYASRHFGFDKGFDYFQDFLFETKMFKRYIKSDSRIIRAIRNIKNLMMKKEVFLSWEKYYEDVITWVESVDKPFFLWVFLLDTHFPYLVPRKCKRWGAFLDMYLGNLRLYNMISRLNADISDKERGKIIDSYDDAVHYADSFVGELTGDLEDYDPLIVCHSDHGEAFFERGVFGHFFPHLYDETLKVPLVISNGNLSERVTKPVSTLDLYSAILNLASNGEVSPSSLTDKREWVISKGIEFHRGGKEMFSVRLGDWKLISEQGEMNELYNLEDDPGERTNLVKKHPRFVEEMKRIVRSHIAHERKRRICEKISRLPLREEM